LRSRIRSTATEKGQGGKERGEEGTWRLIKWEKGLHKRKKRKKGGIPMTAFSPGSTG